MDEGRIGSVLPEKSQSIMCNAAMPLVVVYVKLQEKKGDKSDAIGKLARDFIPVRRVGVHGADPLHPTTWGTHYT